MPKFIPGTVVELTEEQIKAIDWFVANPPKYYKWFYKLYKKILGSVIFVALFTCMILAIINATSHVNLFNLIKYIFFVTCGFGLWALVSHLYKLFYTKRYAKKIGLTIHEWNMVTIGQMWDI